MRQIGFQWSRLLALAGVALVCLHATGWAGAQTSGPLTQYKDNVHQMHIVARYFTTGPSGITVQANTVQTVTAIAVRSQRGQTFWLVEKDHVDPQFFYRERNVPAGTTITFFFFVDVFDIIGLIQGQSDPIEIFKMTDHYAVLKDARARTVPDVNIATDPQENEAAVIALPQGGDITKPATFTENPTQILQVPADSPLFFIAFTQKDPTNERTHGVPVFVLREGEWRLAGIRVAHGRSPQPDQSAAAKLPPLDELTSK